MVPSPIEKFLKPKKFYFYQPVFRFILWLKTTALGMSEHGGCLLSGLLGEKKWSESCGLLINWFKEVLHCCLPMFSLWSMSSSSDQSWLQMWVDMNFLFHSKFNQKINCERGHCSVKAKNYGMSGLLFQDVGLCWHFVYACAIHILIVLWVNKKGKMHWLLSWFSFSCLLLLGFCFALF